MSEHQDDLDLLVDAVADHMDIARHAGVAIKQIAEVTLQVVAEFLLETMAQDQAMELMKKTCADLHARMPNIPKGTH
ncbi:hypothetical protein EN803_33845 [Mesorhizobium sp. M2D.F.Ca.ET.160.01.1.1]|nr:hypothetical protein EN803_33845 [Mesorhizobium sp. M2D.F.Ca.ET.160.01.1.1]